MALSSGYQSGFRFATWSPLAGLIVHRLRDYCKGRENRKELSHPGHTITTPFSHRYHTIFRPNSGINREKLHEKTANSLKINAKAVICCGAYVNRITILVHYLTVCWLCERHRYGKLGRTIPNLFYRNHKRCSFSSIRQATWPNP